MTSMDTECQITYFKVIVAANGGTHAYRRLRWLCVLALAAVGVECIVLRFIILSSHKPNLKLN